MGFVVSVFLILLGVAFLNRATPQPTQSVAVIQQAGAAQADKDREIERLQKRLRRTEQLTKRYHALLSDPTAKRRCEEEILKRRCIELAREIEVFTYGYNSPWQDEREVVARFKLRHESKVTDLRDELDRSGWLTAKEREGLTLSGHDGLEKIKRMADTLRAIGAGH